jgi:hypothetical protein
MKKPEKTVMGLRFHEGKVLFQLRYMSVATGWSCIAQLAQSTIYSLTFIQTLCKTRALSTQKANMLMICRELIGTDSEKH